VHKAADVAVAVAATVYTHHTVRTYMLYYEAIEQRVRKVDCLFVDQIQYSGVLIKIGPT
jgi:hypothetical protein